MQTAETYARGQTLTLNMTDVVLGFSNMDCYLAFYFAEIDPQAVNQSRIFDLYVNEQLEFANISVLQLSGGLMYSTLEIIVGNITLSNTAKLVQLIPHANSALGPILNAYELFDWTSMPSLTFPSDGKSIDSCTLHQFALLLKPTDQCCPVLDFVGSALQGRDIIVMHTKVWYPYIWRSCGVHYQNVFGITKGSTWASPC